MASGARRHCCFSSPRYRSEAARIATEAAARFGQNWYVAGWQIDSE